MRGIVPRIGFWILSICILTSSIVSAQGFYEGKTIRMIVGFSPGSGPDIRARLVSRHLPRHIAGEPKMIVQNIPGAGGRIAFNTLYNVAKKDGLTLATVNRDAAGLQLGEQPGVEYDLTKMSWIGSLMRAANVVFVRSSLPYENLEELKQAKTPLAFAARSPGATNYLAGKALEALGVPVNIVVGYGTSKMNLAFVQGEIDASALSWNALSRGRPDWVKPGGLARLIVEFGTTPTAGLDIPFGPDLQALPDEQAIYTLINKALGLPQGNVAAPPGTPKARVDELQRAFREMLNDSRFRTDAEKLGVILNPLVGDELLKVFKDFLAAPPEAKEQFKKLLG